MQLHIIRPLRNTLRRIISIGTVPNSTEKKDHSKGITVNYIGNSTSLRCVLCNRLYPAATSMVQVFGNAASISKVVIDLHRHLLPG